MAVEVGAKSLLERREPAVSELDRLRPQVVVHVLGFHRPARGEAVLDAGAHGPAGLDTRPRFRGADAEAAGVVHRCRKPNVSVGEPTGSIEQQPTPRGDADPSTQRSQETELLLPGCPERKGARHRSRNRLLGVDVRALKICLDTEDEPSDLVAIPDLVTADDTGRIIGKSTWENVRIDEGLCQRIARHLHRVIAPAVADVEACIETGPVVSGLGL